MPLILSNKALSFVPSMEEELSSRVRERKEISFIAVVPTKRRVRELQRKLLHHAPGGVSPTFNLYTLSLLARQLYYTACSPKCTVQGPVQAVIVNEAINHLAKELKYFFPQENDRLPRGTFQKIIEVLNNMKEKGLYHEQFEQELALAENDEQNKLHDISLIYSEYERRLHKYGYIDAGGIYKELNEHFTVETADQIFRKIFPGVDTFFMEGFSELALPEQHMLESLTCVRSLDIIISFDYDDENPAVFGNLSENVEVFRKHGFRSMQQDKDKEGGNGQFRNHIARHFFARRSPTSKMDMRKEIHLIEATDRRNEVDLVTRIVKKYLIDHPDISPSKICVATYETANYTGLFREIFHTYGIPVNITDRYRLSSSPVIVSILAMLDVARNNFRQKDVLRALASPYCSLAREISGQRSIDTANLYSVARQLKITTGRATWHKHISSRASLLRSELEETTDESEQEEYRRGLEQLARAEEDIRTLEQLLSPFGSPMTPYEFQCNLLRLLDQMQVVSMILNGDKNTMPDHQRELEARAFKKFLSLIDDVLELLEFQGKGKRRETLSFYLDQLKTAVGQVRFNVRQKHGYGVYVTSIEETRGLEFDVMIIAGLVDGEFPALYQPEIFLSKHRRKTEERHAREYRNLFYQGITNFSKELYLFYPRKDEKTELVQSVFIEALRKIAVLHEWSKEEVAQLASLIYSEADLYTTYGTIHAQGNERQGNFLFAGASSIIQENLLHIDHGIAVEQSRIETHALPEYEGIIADVLGPEDKKPLDRMRNRVYSVSQLETYGKCPFQFFAHRILRLSVIESIEEELTPIERGTILHEILFEFYVSRQQAGKPPLAQCSDEDYDVAVQELQQLASRKLNEILVSDVFWDVEKESILGFSTLRRGVLKEFLDKERESTLDTVPAYFEVGFGGKTGLRRKSDPLLSQEEPLKFGNIRMRGKIDRIEIGPSEFGIVDYKTGKTIATRKEIDEGISLQLPMYLHAVEIILRKKMKQPLTPAAGIYYQLRSPVERKLGLGNQEYNEKAFNAHSRSTRLVDNDSELRQVISRAIDTVNEFVDNVAAGKFPLTTPDKIDRVCSYCDYKKICRIQTVRFIEAPKSKE
ncbi:MAG: PD-(D/E)XK nuclease family protein [Bacteroidota bacterium]